MVERFEAPCSPLAIEDIKELAAFIVATPDFEPNTIYLSDKDSVTLWGEVSRLAQDALVVSREQHEELREALRIAEAALALIADGGEDDPVHIAETRLVPVRAALTASGSGGEQSDG